MRHLGPELFLVLGLILDFFFFFECLFEKKILNAHSFPRENIQFVHVINFFFFFIQRDKILKF